MKGKGLAITLLVLTILIAMLGISPVFSVTGVCPVSSFDVEPLTRDWAEPAHSIGEAFDVDVVAKDVVELWGWSAGIAYDPAVIDYTGYTWGDFGTYVTLGPPIEGTINETSGQTTQAWAQGATGGTPPNLTSLTLITFHFELTGYGNSTLDLMAAPFCKASNPEDPAYLGDTDFDLNDGWIRFMPAANVPPVASFTWGPKTYPTANVDITTFDASASYDPDGIGIANMTFDFGSVDAIPTTQFLTSAPWTVNVNYTVDGTFTVNLTVVDQGKPGYYPADATSLTKDITVVPPAPPSGVDVFTIKEWLGRTTLYRERGDGPLADGSAFAPGETVTLRGYAYYMDIPMMAVNVGFQVNDPDVVQYASRASSTDSDGNATISLRLAMVPKFGSYGVVATCRIFETDMSDSLDFEVGWLVDIEVTAPTTVARGAEGTFTVTVTNIDPYDAYPVLLTISVCDLIDVVLNATSLDTSAAVGTADKYLAVTIPLSAMPGFGADVEANAYTDWPALGGTAYCPSDTDTFEIL